MLAQVALMAGIAVVTLYTASGMLGLRILDAARRLYPAELADARSTILVRVVTQSLQAAGTFAAAWFALSISIAFGRAGLWPRWLSGLGALGGVLPIPVFSLPDPFWLLGPVLMIGYALALACRPPQATGPA